MQSPLITLTELARTRVDEAVRQLGMLQSAQVSAQQKLELLLQYRDDYSAQLQSLMAQGLTPLQWSNFQNFLSTLDHAIEQQRSATLQAAQQLDVGRADWQHSKRKLNAFDTLAERMRERALAAEAKRDQRDNDERASRQFFDRSHTH